jgi:ABC-type oligopeptide transport system substrate-binding subunit
MSHCRFLIWLVIGICFFAAGCAESPGSGAAEHGNKVLRRGNGGEPGSLDPALASDIHAFGILVDLYEGLVAEAADGSLIPGVANSWQVSDDGLTYTFRLRNDARWSDGAAVDASDFVRSLRRVVAPETASPYAFLLAPLQNFEAIQAGELPGSELGVRAESDQTLVMSLSTPAGHWLSILAMPIAAPTRPNVAGTVVSNGPYRLADRQAGGLIRLERNAHYWSADSVAIDTVEYHPIVDETAELNRYRSGELDITYTIPSEHFAALQADIPAEVRVAPSLALYYIAFDLTEPPLDSRPLRRALSMAIDRQTLVKLIGRGEQPAYGVVPPGVSGHRNASYEWNGVSDDERIRAAREQYALAGFDSENPLQLKLSYDVGDIHERIALAVTSMWRDVLGVQTTVEKMEWKLLLDTRDQRSAWQAMRFAWFGDYNGPMTFLEIFQSGNPQNLARYTGDDFDELLASAAETVDPDAHAQLMHAAEQTLIDDYPIAPLYFFVSKHLVRPGISGFENNVLNRHPTRFLDMADED